MANYFVYGLYYKESVESYVFYQKRSRLAQLQPLFIATKAILISAGFALFYKFGVGMLYAVLGIQGFYILCIVAIRPFKRGLDLFRAICSELSLAYVLTSRYFMRELVNLEDPKNWSAFIDYGILCEYAAVGFTLLISLISLVYHLMKANKADSQISP